MAISDMADSDMELLRHKVGAEVPSIDVAPSKVDKVMGDLERIESRVERLHPPTELKAKIASNIAMMKKDVTKLKSNGAPSERITKAIQYREEALKGQLKQAE